MPSWRRRWLKPSLAALAVVTTLSLVNALQWREQALERSRLLARYPGRSLCTEPAEAAELVYRYKAGECGFNAQGYRDRARSVAKVAGSFRIVLIGDSVAEGQDLPMEQGMAAQLETLLQQGGLAAEVVLLARSGYSTSQQLYLLEHEVAAYQPDLVLWSYVLNDPAHPVFHNANGELGRYHHNTRVPLLAFAARKSFRLRERVLSLRCPEELHAQLHCVYRSRVAKNVAAIRSWSERNEVPVRMVLHPVFEQGRDFDAYGLESLHQELAELFTAHHLPVLDLLQAYRGSGSKVLNQQPADGSHDPWHPNALGHRLAAEAIESWLLADPGLLGGRHDS